MPGKRVQDNLALQKVSECLPNVEGLFPVKTGGGRTGGTPLARRAALVGVTGSALTERSEGSGRPGPAINVRDLGGPGWPRARP